MSDQEIIDAVRSKLTELRIGDKVIIVDPCSYNIGDIGFIDYMITLDKREGYAVQFPGLHHRIFFEKGNLEKIYE